MDKGFLDAAKENGWRDGVCVVAALLIGDELHIANTGDCQAILGRVPSGGEAPKSVALS